MTCMPCQGEQLGYQLLHHMHGMAWHAAGLGRQFTTCHASQRGMTCTCRAHQQLRTWKRLAKAPSASMCFRYSSTAAETGAYRFVSAGGTLAASSHQQPCIEGAHLWWRRCSADLHAPVLASASWLHQSGRGDPRGEHLDLNLYGRISCSAAAQPAAIPAPEHKAPCAYCHDVPCHATPCHAMPYHKATYLHSCRPPPVQHP